MPAVSCRPRGRPPKAHTPLSYANRGMWLEAAVTRTAAIYRERGCGYLAKIPTATRMVRGYGPDPKLIHCRQPDEQLVDFMGVIDDRAVAIECKISGAARYDLRGIKAHQLAMLQAYGSCGGIGVLLIHGSRMGKTWLVQPDWLLAKAGVRTTVNWDRFPAGAREGGCVEVVHGRGNVPLDLQTALQELIPRRAR